MFSMLTLCSALVLVAVDDKSPRRLSAQTVGEKLAKQRITLDWEDQKLGAALKELSQFSGVRMIVAPALRDMDEDGVNLKLSNVAVSSVMRILQRTLGIRYFWKGGALWATTPEDAVRRTSVLRIYDVRAALMRITDFPGPEIGIRPTRDEDFEDPEQPEGMDPDELVDLIRRGVGESEWEFDGVTLSILGGRLIVRHTPTVQRKVAELIQFLAAR